jgi:hypothetical protein
LRNGPVFRQNGGFAANHRSAEPRRNPGGEHGAGSITHYRPHAPCSTLNVPLGSRRLLGASL